MDWTSLALGFWCGCIATLTVVQIYNVFMDSKRVQANLDASAAWYERNGGGRESGSDEELNL